MEILTDKYIQEVDSFLEDTIDDDLNKYNKMNEIQKLYQLTLVQYKTTEEIEKEFIQNKAIQIRRRWTILQNILIIVILLICIFSFLDGRQMIKQIVMPLEHLTQKTKEISEGRFKIQSDEILNHANSEVERLTNAFCVMSEKIEGQMEELKNTIILSKKLHELELQNMEMRVLLSEVEMDLVQSLMNPHFVFNCFGMLSSMALLENSTKIYQYSLKLAHYFRGTLSLIGKIITANEEIKLLQNYIEIQKNRFGTRISFETYCDVECSDTLLPAMILQPLVENSLIHGVGANREGGIIQIQVYRNNSRVSVFVKDNGIGISKDKLNLLLEELSYWENDQIEKLLKRKKTGLFGVVCRMKNYYDNDVGINVESKIKLGFEISFDIPYCKEN